MDTSTSLATFKVDNIMITTIYKGRGKEDMGKLLEPFLVGLYEGLLKTYNYDPDYIVKDLAKPNSLSTASMNEILLKS